jgi:lysozyme
MLRSLSAPLLFAALVVVAAAQPARAVVYGLDVYNGNGAMNWPLIAGAGKDFAFVKATEGIGFTDASLSINQSQGTVAGLLIGCYDFARPDTNSPAAEADYYVSAVSARGGFAAGKLLPMLDFEHAGSTGAANPSAWVNAWCAEVKIKTGLESIVYTYPSFASSNLNSTVTSHPLFIASYDHTNPASNPSVTGPWNGSYAFWQYTSTGRVVGDPAGAVDLDTYNGNIDSLVANFAIGGIRPAVAVPEPALATTLLGAALVAGIRRRKSK